MHQNFPYEVNLYHLRTVLSVQDPNPRGSKEKIDLGKMEGKKLLVTGVGGERKTGGSGFCVCRKASYFFL